MSPANRMTSPWLRVAAFHAGAHVTPRPSQQSRQRVMIRAGRKKKKEINGMKGHIKTDHEGMIHFEWDYEREGRELAEEAADEFDVDAPHDR